MMMKPNAAIRRTISTVILSILFTLCVFYLLSPDRVNAAYARLLAPKYSPLHFGGAFAAGVVLPVLILARSRRERYVFPIIDAIVSAITLILIFMNI